MSTPRGVGAQAQVARLLTLVPFLHHHEQVRLDEAAELLGATPEQVLRDLKVLFMCGLPGGMPDDLIDVDLEAIETDEEAPRADGVIRVSNADYLDRPMRLSPIEASALMVSLRLLRESAAGETVTVVDRVLEKLQVAADSAAAERQVEVAAEYADLAALADRLDRAARDQQQVRLLYHHPARDEVSERRVDPRGVVRQGGHAYLDAHCHRAAGPRLFRLDRIAAAEVLDRPTETVPEPPRDLADGPLLGGEGDTLQTVTLRLAPAGLWMTEYYETGSPRPLPGGGAEVDLQVADSRWLDRLLLRLAPHATLVAPVELSEGFTATARETLALYR